jgi:hypothetical protein
VVARRAGGQALRFSKMDKSRKQVVLEPGKSRDIYFNPLFPLNFIECESAWKTAVGPADNLWMDSGA